MIDTVICIPSRRQPPFKSLVNYNPDPYEVIIVSDPDYYQIHKEFYGDRRGIRVVLGARGNGPQCAACYISAAEAGFPYFFKMDDDLTPKTFVHANGTFPDLPTAIGFARECLDVTKTTHAGFCNTSRRDWLGEGYGRTYGLIHGGGNIGISAKDPSGFIDTRLVRGEDVYRTCAHRELDGAVGRVRFIGFNKRESADTSSDSSSKHIDPAAFEETRRIILERFPKMVTCDGTRWVGTTQIPNWKLRR